MSVKNIRRRFFVDRLIQGRIVGRIAMYWVLYHVVMWHSLFVFRYLQYRSATLSGEAPTPFGELYGDFVADFYPVALFALVTFPIFLFDIVRLTHRVAGPILRFTDVMRAVLKGERVPPIKLRRNDLLTPFQDTFNKFTAEFEHLRDSQTARDEQNESSADRLSPDQAEQIADLVRPQQTMDAVAAGAR